MKKDQIQSLKDLQLQMPSIIEKYGSDNNLTRLALANPIAALERTGLQFTAEAKQEIETHARFGKEGAAQYNALKQKIHETSSSNVNLNNNEAVADLIIRLAAQSGDKAQKRSKKDDYTTSADINREDLINRINKQPQMRAGQWKDELEAFADVHPVVPLLIEYRRMEAERPGFTPSEAIPRIEEKIQKGPLTNVIFTLKRNSTGA